MIRYDNFADVPGGMKRALWKGISDNYGSLHMLSVMRGKTYNVIGGDVILVDDLFDLHYIKAGGKSLLEAPIDADAAYETDKWYVIFIVDNDAGGNAWFIPKSIASTNPKAVVERLKEIDSKLA